MLDANKILLINCSYPNYNLAIEKMKIYFGDRAREGRRVDDLFNSDCDGVMLSVIFSWDAPYAVEQAQRFFYSPMLWRKMKLQDYAPRINSKSLFV